MEDCKVLIMEDDEAARNMLARVIKKEGFMVLTAENGRIGLDVFKKESPLTLIIYLCLSKKLLKSSISHVL